MKNYAVALAVSFKSRLKANACLFVFKQRNLPDFTSKGSWQAGRTGKSFFSASQRGPSLVNDLKICFCTPLAAGKSVSWIFFPLFFAAFLMITAHKAQPSVIPAQGSSLGWCSVRCDKNSLQKANSVAGRASFCCWMDARPVGALA